MVLVAHLIFNVTNEVAHFGVSSELRRKMILQKLVKAENILIPKVAYLISLSP